MQLQKVNKKQPIEIDFTPEQVQLLKSQIAPKATNDELKLFLNQCKRTGLDPFARQIYAIHRNQYNSDKKCYEKKMTIQTSIDGFRVIAERSGDYAGQDEPIFNEIDGKLISCKVTVYRFKSAQKYAIPTRYAAAVGVAYWDEFKQTGKDGKESEMWAKMPRTMLSKVAEAIALRKAYPQDLSGLYTGEEMAQSANEITPNEEKKTSIEQMGVDYNAMLMNCISIDELKMLKSILPDHLSKNDEFKKAAIERYNQINKTEQKEYLYKKNENGFLTKHWEDVIHNITNNNYTLEKIKEQFNLTKEMEEEVKFQISILNHIDDFNGDDDKKQLNEHIELTHI
jgi:phage recombination protein Bet